jgi:SAM-dependent methyltransferase
VSAVPQPSHAHAPERCENCGAAASWERAFADRSDVDRCRSCGGWTFTGPVPLPADELYGEEYFNGGEYAGYDAARASHQRNFQRKLRLLQRHGAPGPGDTRLLELGCATGEFLAEARRAGVAKALGLEVSGYCRDVARGRGHEVLSPDDASAEAAVKALRPNVIVAWDVWEHLRAPASTLDALLREAERGVTVAVTTVDAGSAVARLRGTRWRQFHPPTHLCYPTRRSLRLYFERLGFEIMHHGSFGYYRPLTEYLRVFGVRASASPPAWMTTPIFLDLYDIQLVIARRTAP